MLGALVGGDGSGRPGMVGTTGPGAGAGPPGTGAPEAGVDGVTVGVEDFWPPPGVGVGRGGVEVRDGDGLGVPRPPAGWPASVTVRVATACSSASDCVARAWIEAGS